PPGGPASSSLGHPSPSRPSRATRSISACPRPGVRVNPSLYDGLHEESRVKLVSSSTIHGSVLVDHSLTEPWSFPGYAPGRRSDRRRTSAEAVVKPDAIAP